MVSVLQRPVFEHMTRALVPLYLRAHSLRSRVPGCGRHPMFRPTCLIDRRRNLPENTRPMSHPLSHKRLAVLGAGKMGGILLRAFLDQKLVSQMKRGDNLIVTGLSAKGVASQDTFSLDGFTKAYAAISEACGVK